MSSLRSLHPTMAAHLADRAKRGDYDQRVSEYCFLFVAGSLVFCVFLGSTPYGHVSRDPDDAAQILKKKEVA